MTGRGARKIRESWEILKGRNSFSTATLQLQDVGGGGGRKGELLCELRDGRLKFWLHFTMQRITRVHAAGGPHPPPSSDGGGGNGRMSRVELRMKKKDLGEKSKFMAPQVMVALEKICMSA